MSIALTRSGSGGLAAGPQLPGYERRMRRMRRMRGSRRNVTGGTHEAARRRLAAFVTAARQLGQHYLAALFSVGVALTLLPAVASRSEFVSRWVGFEWLLSILAFGTVVGTASMIGIWRTVAYPLAYAAISWGMILFASGTVADQEPLTTGTVPTLWKIFAVARTLIGAGLVIIALVTLAPPFRRR